MRAGRIFKKRAAGIAGFLALVTAATAAQADLSNVTVSGGARVQNLSQRDRDLGATNDGNLNGQSVQGELRVAGDASENISFRTDLRAVANFGRTGSEDEFGRQTTQKDFFELRQLWVKYKGIGGTAPLALQLGRQRFSEDRGLWWNRDVDSVRLAYEATLLKGFVAVGEDLGSHRLAGGDFTQEDENLFHVLSEVSNEWAPGQFAGGRFHLQADHSGIEPVGAVLRSADYDQHDEDLVWLGFFINGQAERYIKALPPMTYNIDITGVTGRDMTLATAAGPGATQRTVIAGSASRDVRAWGFDSNINIPVTVAEGFAPTAIFGYAYGSGDAGATGTDGNFRQSNMSSNTAKQGGMNRSTNSYGYVFRPELTNIHIFTAGAAVPVLEGSELAFILHHYRRAETSALGSVGITAPLAAGGNVLGNELDMVLDLDLNEELDLNVGEALSARVVLGGFRAGNAYGTNSEDFSTRGLFEIGVKF